MYGWFTVFAFAGVLIAVAFYLVRRAIERWWDWPLLLIIAALTFRPLLEMVSGDVSRWLPGALWSDGADGKDQIIWASIASTLFLPIIAAATIMIGYKALMLKWKRNV